MHKLSNLFKNKLVFYILMLSAMLIKYFPFGLSYFMYQDDITQYGAYSLYQNDIWNNIIVENNLFAFRPLASLLDAYIITPLLGRLWIVLLIMILLHFATIWLLEQIFSKSNICWGKTAALLFGLYPMLAEATYWISASSRLVTGLFLSVLSIYLLLLFIENNFSSSVKRRTVFLLSMLSGILAQSFYEQVIAFSLVFSILILILNNKKIKNKLVYIIPVINFMIIGLYYFCFRNVGGLSARGQMSVSELFSSAGKVLTNIWSLFFIEQRFTIIYTIKKGFLILIKNNLPIFIAVIIISLILSFCLYIEKNNEKVTSPGLLSIIAAIIFFIAPFAPFFVLQYSYIYLRNIYISIIAIAIISQIIWNALIKVKYMKAVGAFFAFIIILTSICCNIFEVDGMRITEKYNNLISKNVIQEIENINRPHSQVYVFNVKYEYEPMPAPHFANVTIADWSFTGQVEFLTRSMHDNYENFYIYPILPGNDYNKALFDDNIILIGLDGEYNAKELYIKDDVLYFKETDNIFGNIKIDNVSGYWKFLISG